MAEIDSNEKPCKVNTERGFSVIYKNRPLYSKYNPEKSICQAIDSLTFTPGTLILIFSPVLWHGLKLLFQKVPENCFIFACEQDKELYTLANQELKQITSSEPEILQKKQITLLTAEQSKNLPLVLMGAAKDFSVKIPPAAEIKKVIRLDFSAGVQFAPDFYNTILSECQQVISQFWKNRLTLLRFGRLYSVNLFQNLARSAGNNTIFFASLKHSITKPILICATGESLEKTVPLLKNNEFRQKLYILAVDASMPILKSCRIMPDAIIGVESQLAIEKSYIGIKNFFEKGGKKEKEEAEYSPPVFFADITSRPHVADLVKSAGGKLCYFSSLYDNNDFLDFLQTQGLLPEVIPPLGSVGLAAVTIAQKLRKSDAVPIFVSGLDFAYSAGKTHARGAFSHINMLFNRFRLSSNGNYEAAFGTTSTTVPANIQGRSIIKLNKTTAKLSDYAQSFKLWFASTKNLFKLEDEGFCLGIPEIKTDVFCNIIENTGNSGKNNSPGKMNSPIPEESENKSYEVSKISDFILNEKKSLEELKETLVTGGNLSKPDFDKKVLELLKNRNYLFLHFPDGTKASTDLSFLKRVRSEIDFFIKNLSIALKRIEE